PRRWDGNEFRLHATAGRILGIEQDARQRDTLAYGKLLEGLGLLVLRQICEDRYRVIRLELAYALGHRRSAQLCENRFPEGGIDFGPRDKTEAAPQQLDQAGTQLRLQPLDQITEVGRMQIARQFAQRR